MMVIDNKFNIGDSVFLKTDQEQKEKLVTCIKITPNGILYILSSGETETVHYDIEITAEKDVLKSTSN